MTHKLINTGRSFLANEHSICNLPTKKLVLGIRPFDEAEEELREVADDDEGRGQCRTTVVFNNQVIPLKLPEDVGVALHHLECVAANGKKRTKSQ